ncbi:molybdopterin-binding protein [Vulcanibacillus modesticaldus]|uniref:Molybdopterin molybdenumtransferase n=1 Tax=Vulcanibacillus modesticaldus TaxID=337097 RepID=A0A1D2YX28_9BACI|nr:molybdopterin-binding protein [Vulcanibacillus modesticaldus]OEG00264.1 molybdopterin-binding protein [Vulcanibacillus modesticaldus]
MVDNSMLKEIKVEDAVGYTLAHDLTKIIPGEFKGRIFKKGHVIQKEDIPELLKIGKEHIYVLNIKEGYLHENDAAYRLAKAIAGKNVLLDEPHEGKITLTSKIFGLVKVNETLINQINSIPDLALATVFNNKVVQPGGKLAGTRALPLIIEEEKVNRAEALLEGKIAIEVKEFKKSKVGLVTTGSEVYKGRIKDRFGPIVKKKLNYFGSDVVEQRFVPDDVELIKREIEYFLKQQVDIIMLTGGMSVDPDDRTPYAIREMSTKVVTQGTPILPGSNLMIAYNNDTPILGLPGGVLHDPYTSFDVVLPRILANDPITKEEINRSGYGGYYGC